VRWIGQNLPGGSLKCALWRLSRWFNPDRRNLVLPIAILSAGGLQCRCRVAWVHAGRLRAGGCCADAAGGGSGHRDSADLGAVDGDGAKSLVGFPASDLTVMALLMNATGIEPTPDGTSTRQGTALVGIQSVNQRVGGGVRVSTLSLSCSPRVSARNTHRSSV